MRPFLLNEKTLVELNQLIQKLASVADNLATNQEKLLHALQQQARRRIVDAPSSSQARASGGQLEGGELPFAAEQDPPAAGRVSASRQQLPAPTQTPGYAPIEYASASTPPVGLGGKRSFRRRRRNLDDETINSMRRDWLAGHSGPSIARKFGVSAATVYKHCKTPQANTVSAPKT